MIKNSHTFTIGTGNGQYPAGTTITDTLFRYANVGSIIHNQQSYNNGYAITDGTLDFNAIITTVNGDKVTVNFETPIHIN